MTAEFKCLYCGYTHQIGQSTLEHAIPKSLGGAHAPDQFKLRNACRKCNNDLGAYVDASFAKSWFVTNSLAMAARKLYDGASAVPLPLTCIGPTNISGIQMPKGYLSESWIGPSGEYMVWLRPEDETLYWYVGGNPRHRSEPSTVYWFPTSDDPQRLRIGFQSLEYAFKSRRQARKVMGVPCHGFPGNGYPPGFDVPNGTDVANIAAIRAPAERFRGRTSFNLEFDYRFISKLALGVGYSLFGEAFASSDHAKELQKGCWPKNQKEIGVRGVPTFGPTISMVAQVASYPGAVVLTVMLVGDSYALVLTIDEGRPFIVSLAPATIKSTFVDPLKGYSLLLFPSIRHHVEMTLAGLIGHRNGSWKFPPLAAIDERLARADQFWSALPPLPTRS